jgi:outer membrane protein assembly factor BamD (BamD/ComL family)
MNSIYGYQSFLSKFPLSHHATQAQQAIQIKERNVQDAARQRDSEKARRLNEQVEDAWQVALKENSILAYRDFLGAYPNSKYSGQARIQLSLLEDRFKEKG